MINGFEKQTHDDLTITEQKVMRLLVQNLPAHKGKANAISNKQLIGYMDRAHGLKITEPRVRKLLNIIRTHDLVPLLLANSTGYWVAASRREVDIYIESLEQRINSQIELKDSLSRQLNERLNKA